MAARDQLFLLTPLFPDAKAGPGAFYCPECSQIEGTLSWFPFLRSRIEVAYLDFPRPRTPIIDLIGVENQGCPVLVFAGDPPAGVAAKVHAPTGRRFVAGAAAIGAALAAAHGVSLPHP
jgi:hypothetical protein